MWKSRERERPRNVFANTHLSTRAPAHEPIRTRFTSARSGKEEFKPFFPNVPWFHRPPIVMPSNSQSQQVLPRPWSAVDGGHARFVVALAGGRRQVIEALELAGGQFYAVGGGVLLDTGDPPGAGDRSDVLALGEQPGQRDLRRDRPRTGRCEAPCPRGPVRPARRWPPR